MDEGNQDFASGDPPSPIWTVHSFLWFSAFGTDLVMSSPSSQFSELSRPLSVRVYNPSCRPPNCLAKTLPLSSIISLPNPSSYSLLPLLVTVAHGILPLNSASTPLDLHSLSQNLCFSNDIR